MKKVFTHMLIPKKSVGFPPWLGGMCLLLFATFLIHAREWAKDESGQPLPGAGAWVKSTSNDVTLL